MKKNRGREVGEAFSFKELSLLDRLCQGNQPDRGLAREQLRVASWGGYEFDECDCFLISVPTLPESSLIEHDGGPFSTLDVSSDGEGFGLIELWVVDGYLHSVDYIPFDDHARLPELEDVSLDPLD